MKLSYSIKGLAEYTVDFSRYCVPCKWASKCKFGGKDKPSFEVDVSCKELKYVEEELQFKYVTKVQKEGGDMVKATEKKIQISKILSQIWQDKVKSRKDEIYCINTHNLDLIIVSNRSKEWWSEFAKIGKEIIAECKKIF